MKSLFKALATFQQEVGSVKKDSKNPFLKNKYSSLDEMIKHCSPLLTKNGLSIIQLISDSGVNTMLCHESGETIETGNKLMPVQVTKGLSHGQAEGVVITYTRRYQYAGILNLSTEEDTDGQIGDNKELNRSKPKPVEKPKPTEKEIEEGRIKMIGCESMKELGAVYTSFSHDLQKALTSKKDELKVKLSK